MARTRATSVLGEVRNVEIPRATQQLLCSKSHDFLAIFALAHSKINQTSPSRMEVPLVTIRQKYALKTNSVDCLK